jgi:hypothetical protein
MAISLLERYLRIHLKDAVEQAELFYSKMNPFDPRPPHSSGQRMGLKGIANSSK